MRRRNVTPAERAGVPPYITSPAVGDISVASNPISVDFPAPFGPIRPTISPERAVSETRVSARRRPKWRDTSPRLTESNPLVAPPPPPPPTPPPPPHPPRPPPPPLRP